MRYSTLFGLAFAGMTAVLSAACSSGTTTEPVGQSPSALRSVSGRVQAKAGTTVTEVVALKAEKSGVAPKMYSAPVDATGHFTLELPKGSRYVLEIMAGKKAIGTLRFAASAGGPLTSLLPVANAPGEALQAQGEGAAKDNIDLGDVDAAEGQSKPSKDPLDQVDSDNDGSSDFADGDDDNDGTPDEADADDDDNGVIDKDEDHDDDDDGVSNDCDDDDNNDGIPDDNGGDSGGSGGDSGGNSSGGDSGGNSSGGDSGGTSGGDSGGTSGGDSGGSSSGGDSGGSSSGGDTGGSSSGGKG